MLLCDLEPRRNPLEFALALTMILRYDAGFAHHPVQCWSQLKAFMPCKLSRNRVSFQIRDGRQLQVKALGGQLQCVPCLHMAKRLLFGFGQFYVHPPSTASCHPSDESQLGRVCKQRSKDGMKGPMYV